MQRGSVLEQRGQETIQVSLFQETAKIFLQANEFF
jgi:hypothetical protein